MSSFVCSVAHSLVVFYLFFKYMCLGIVLKQCQVYVICVTGTEDHIEDTSQGIVRELVFASSIFSLHVRNQMELT